jgi:vacuolar-type H+-ATPase subunit I/STV1
MPQHFVDPMEEIVINLQAKVRDLEKELSDTKANLHRAYDGIAHYKEKWKKVLELNANLQKELENTIH